MAKRTYPPRSRSASSKKAKIYRAPKNKFLLGNSVRTTLKYIEAISLNPGVAGVPATYVFSANGAYDPNITGVGHQPRGFDQLAALYDHYYVMNATIKITWTSLRASSTENFVVGVQLQDDATPEADMIQAMEGRHTDYTCIQSSGDIKKTSLKFNAQSFFSINDRLTYGDRTQNPGDQAYFVCFVQPPTALDQNAVEGIVEIQYDIKFTEPNNVAAS